MLPNNQRVDLCEEPFACDFCGQNIFTRLFTGSDIMHGLPGDFEVVICDTCGLISLYPQPEDLADYYPPQTYHAYVSKFSETNNFQKSVSRSLLQRAKWVAKQFPSDTSSRYLLDLGCGEGAFLRAILLTKISNVVKIGLDFSWQACSAGNLPGQIETTVGTLDALPLKSDTFDVITMWHVLEHVRQPKQALSEVKRLLKPDGKVILACPVIDSFEARLFGKYWCGFDVPRHLHTFSRALLKVILQDSGFECYEIKGLIAGWNSIKTSWQFLLGFAKLQNLLASILAWPIFLIDRLFFRRPSVAVFVAIPSHQK